MGGGKGEKNRKERRRDVRGEKKERLPEWGNIDNTGSVKKKKTF